ncbi:Exocyst complex component S5 [Thecaphora frezii]
MAATLDFDEAALLKAYRLDTLEPSSWHMSEQDDAENRDSNATGVADEPDPLGLRSTMAPFRTLNKETKTQISLSSKAFDPKLFLSTVHPDATFADLSYGVMHLKQSIDQRSEALKVLVEDNFDRFVAVKATTDGVYREMRESDDGPLRDDADYGTKQLKEILAQASAKADQVFMPVLENNLKTVKLRSTLGVFERSKFFFNLPGSLSDSVELGRYDVALRDYKKGKYLLDSRPGQLLAFNTAAGQAGSIDPSAAGSAKQQAQQRRVFAKVWDAVEATMKEMQTRLLAQLREPKRSVEEQEKTIEVLLELDPNDDPVSVYLESQHSHIRSLMRKAFDSNVAKVEAVRSISRLVPRTPKDRAKDIQKCVTLIRSGADFDKAIGADGWKAIHELVRSVSETIVSTLPGFWRVAKNHMEGKFTKGKSGAGPNADRIFAQSKAWATEALDAYVSLLSHFFTLTDVSILARQPLSPLPDWVPSGTCSATAAHFMRSTLVDLIEAVNDLAVLGIASSSSLKGLLSNARFRFTEVLCHLWQEDAKLFYLLEDWTPNTEEQATTLYLKDMAAFHKSNARQAYHIAGGRDRESLDGGRSRELAVPSEFTARIKAAFLDALYAFLDGLIQLAFSEYDPLDPSTTTSQKLIGDSKLTVDVRDLDTRILLSVTNLTHLNKTVVPNLVKQFQDAYQIKMVDDLKTIDEVAHQLDSILFSDFIRRKSALITTTLRTGILSSGINWQTIPKPSGVHPFIYESLLLLVQIHAQVRAVTKPLVTRTILALVEDLAKETLECFTKIPRFGMGGMLQATLEIEFIHQTMAQYISDKAEATLKKVYETISHKYQRSADASDAGGSGSGGQQEAEILKRELERVKKTLMESRKATALEFLCFRKARPRERERDKDKDKDKGEVSDKARASSDRGERERERERERDKAEKQ